MVCWCVCRCLENMEFTQADRRYLDKSEQDTGSFGNSDDALKYDSGHRAHDFSCIHSKGTANTQMKGWWNVWASPSIRNIFFIYKGTQPSIVGYLALFSLIPNVKNAWTETSSNLFKASANCSSFCVIWHSIIYSNIVPIEQNDIMYNFHSKPFWIKVFAT